MALDDIFKALEEQAEKDVEAVLDEARAHAAAIIQEAERDAAAVREQRLAEAEYAAAARSAQDLNAARLDARRRIAVVKERALRRAFDGAHESLAGIRERADYPSIFSALADEALEGVPSSCDLRVDPRDVALASECAARTSVGVAVVPELTCSGGLSVATDGGRVMRRNTLEDRLEKFQGVALADVAEILFG